MTLLLRGGTVPGDTVFEGAAFERTVTGTTETQLADVLVGDDGLIAEIGPDLSAPAGTLELDASGATVAPGLVDLQANLCQPGFEEGETIETGSRAAVLGGYTAVVVMPNTNPAVDSAGVVREVRAYAEKALCHIEVAGAITVGRAGEQLAPIGEMASLGVRIFTDADTGVTNDRLMRRAMEYAAGMDVTLALHADVESLSADGHMNEGEWSSRLGIPGIPAEAEELMVMRDIALCRLTGARVHFQHLSTAASIAMVVAARDQGLPVTFDVTPANFTLTDGACASFDAQFKVSPPLRATVDRDAVRAALHAGSVDAIATNHAPQPAHLKDHPFDLAPAGALGLQTALALVTTQLGLDMAQTIELMSTGPARVAGLHDSHGGPLAAGRPANLMVFDPDVAWTVNGAQSASLSRNTPYEGMQLRGQVRHTIVNGRAVVRDAEIQGAVQ